ncbi:MAG: type II toxin-antitoxin system RelE/ParE family toxin [Elusimicrobia bacterium]|nr:type II toxin-antitoxin system RelE/ParE family toxin [Elusimicrobiota bacterium]
MYTHLRRAIIHRTARGVEPYVEFLDSLEDREGAAKIRVHVTRARLGNLGRHRSVGGGVVELKVDFGPGYRVYVGLDGTDLIVLLCAGDKSRQTEDIRNAIAYWGDYRRRG